MRSRGLPLLLAALLTVGASHVARADDTPPVAPETGAPQNAGPAGKPAPSDSLAIPKRLGKELVSDFKWTANNLEADGEDFVKSPCHAGELLRNPTFYWTTLAAGGALGVTFALDEPARRAFRDIGDKTGSNLEDWGGLALLSATGALYAYGFAFDDSRARQYALTGMLSTAISGLITSGLKSAFGRERPHQNNGNWKWFKGGTSFVSAATTPAFALAADLSEYADNRWYVALPAYSVAAAVGLGRMAEDAHWLSDVMGSALLGVGTTELFLHLHALHGADRSRYRIFPMPVKSGVGLGVSVVF
ncbi:MAG TPA: phosphatase PAP2 family protein [Myxococcota bacterium]|nr:phosphatase PAP2 family protein [Myxococcota bacterium]